MFFFENILKGFIFFQMVGITRIFNGSMDEIIRRCSLEKPTMSKIGKE